MKVKFQSADTSILQVEISEDSREITTFITKKGLYRYTRLMFGIVCAPEIFQQIMETILSGCKNCLNFMDDIVIYGKTEQELVEHTNAVLHRLKEYNVLLNQEKCKFKQQRIRFLGHMFSSDGLDVNEVKVQAIKSFRPPNTVEEVRSFLGLVTYVSKFIPNLATVTDPLRKLTKKDTPFEWSDEQQNAFQQLKDQLSSPTTLGYYKLSDRTQLYADASPVGLGAVLVQFDGSEPRIISYASKSLSDTEKRYCQTEKEALALVWSVERFHFYLFGRSFELITDHKALEVIFSPKSKPCARIERWVLRLQSYRYTVVYRAGKNNIADPLSRLVKFEQTNESFDEENEQYVQSITSLATPVAIRLIEIKEASIDDAEIKAVEKALYNSTWSELASPFRVFETELCFVDKILLRGNRIVIPEKLRSRILDLAHEGHPGITKMKQRLRTKVWWPKIDAHAEAYVKQCHGCTMVSAPPPPVPVCRSKFPDKPWQHLAIDFLGPLPSNDYLLVVVDYYSRFIEIDVMRKIDSAETIKRLCVMFARFGNPISITADNGTQLVSEEFKGFCNENNILLISTIPWWPQENGEIERQNRSILKRLIISQNQKRNWKQDLLTYLIMYRATPHSTTLKTPSEMMYGRTIRDKIPTFDQPMVMDDEMRDRDAQAKQKGKEYTDKRRNAKPSATVVGDTVWLKKMSRPNKLAPTFDPVPHTVVEKKGNELIVLNPATNARYRRSVSHAIKAVSHEWHGNRKRLKAYWDSFSLHRIYSILFSATHSSSR